MESKERGEKPPGSKFKRVAVSFDEALKNILKANKRDDLIEALTILTKVLTNLVSLEPKADAHGTERSMQSKFRTIFSENTVINNSLLSIGGNIEDLLILMGY
jgi:hypothetical protein